MSIYRVKYTYFRIVKFNIRKKTQILAIICENKLPPNLSDLQDTMLVI